MLSSAYLSLSRVYFLIRYHKLNQIGKRIWKRTSIPLKHFAFSVCFEPTPLTYTTALEKLPTRDDFPGNIIPLQNVPSKFPRLTSAFEDNSMKPGAHKFEVHSHRFLMTQNPTESLWSDVHDWISKFPLKTPKSYQLSWHPYVCSKRIQHWLALWIRIPPPLHLQSQIISSLYQQLLWLEANLETDIGGNHLWENAQSLVLGGSFFQGKQPQRWLKTGLYQLKSCLSSQLLPHGEHFEKSPSYHWELTHGLLFLLPWIKRTACEEFDYFLSATHKMLKFAQDIAHPNGVLPFFNDSWKTKVSPSRELSSHWTGDYFISRSDSFFFIFDAGDLGEDSLPAHSHCDLLTFELSYNSSPLIVNSGTYCYQGANRNLYRNSKAHNVLLINGKDSGDCWSAFRMGRRGHTIQKQMKKVEDGMWITGSHDAYKHLGFPKVSRIWFISDSKAFLCSFHVVKKTRSGMGFQEFIHLSPEVGCFSSHQQIRLEHNKQNFWFQPIGPKQSLSLDETYFSPQFSVEIPTKSIVLSYKTDTETRCVTPVSGWCLASSKNELNISLEVIDNQLRLQWYQDGRLRQSVCPFSLL